MTAAQSHDTLTRTRRTLHGIAEHILTAQQWRAAGTIRLDLWPEGFGTRTLPGTPALIGVRGTDLFVEPGERLVPISGSLGELAAHAGVRFGLAGAPYHPASGSHSHDVAVVDAGAAAELVAAWWAGHRAMTELAAASEVDGDTTPVLWPEHFDLGVTIQEVNYGVSPGDDQIDRPYAYVGPWTPRQGAFWTHAFGAARLISDLGDHGGVLEFFTEGRHHALRDPAVR
jgi:hypothetical protein